jgi:RNA polymerase sigma factor (TIGR02999 family)
VEPRHANDDLTRLLADFDAGEQRTLGALLPLVYGELRRLAAAQFAEERTGHTLQPTALVNEAWLRLADQPGLVLESRAHFFRLAARVMRQVLIDHARARAAMKRGGANERLSLTEVLDPGTGPEVDLLDLEDALVELGRLSPEQARLVELRFFAGFSIDEAALALSISRTRAVEQWRAAKAWLADELG